MNYGLCAKELEIIQEILSHYEVIQSAVLFGSSVTGNFKTASDVDIALKGAITIKLIAKIKAEFEDSNLPFFVDIVDYAKADNALKNEIDTQGVMLYPHFKATTNTWQRVKLGEIAEIKTDIWKVGGEQEQYIGLEHIAADSLRLCGIGNSNEVSSNKYIFKENDILFGKLRPYFRKIIKAKFKGICSTDIWVIRAKQNIDQTFLFYFFANKTLINLSYSSSKGTRMPRADWNFLSQTTWLLPPLETQHKIAEILRSLDDKIDLLHRQNKTLESLSLTLFRHTFIDNPNRNEWEEKPLSEIAEIKIGRTPPRKEKQWFSTDSKNTKWISIKDMEEKIFIFNTSEFLTAEAINKFKIPIIPPKTIILSFKMTLGRVGITTENMLSNEAIAHFNLYDKYEHFTEYLYLFLKTFKYETLGSTSSIVTAINTSLIKNIKIAIPDKTTLNDFQIQAKGFFDKIYNNSKQIQSLESLRDIMLPKLLSGEVEV